jgi:hypothetical protein
VAKTDIPNALDMQAYKYGDQPPAKRDALAERLRAAGRRSEAILLFDGRPEHPFLQEEIQWAASEGIAFHLMSLRGIGAEISDEILRNCAAVARERGRWMDARTCYVALEDRQGLLEIAEHLPASLRIEGAGAQDAGLAEATSGS